MQVWNTLASQSAPASVCPPGGETLGQAQERLRGALISVLKRQKDRVPLLVLRPMALGLLRCLLEKKGLEMFWQHAKLESAWCSYEADEVSL